MLINIKPKDQVKMYVQNELVLECTGEELLKMSPGWNGDFGVGDIITANDEKKRIIEISTRFPDAEEENTIYEIKLD